VEAKSNQRRGGPNPGCDLGQKTEQCQRRPRQQAANQTSAPAGQHDAAVRAFALRLPAPVAWGDFSAALDALQSLWGERLLRVKGLVHVAGEARPRVIQCVHHLRYPDAALPAWPQGARETRLVFIVRELDPAVVERAFACFCVPELVA